MPVPGARWFCRPSENDARGLSHTGQWTCLLIHLEYYWCLVASVGSRVNNRRERLYIPMNKHCSRINMTCMWLQVHNIILMCLTLMWHLSSVYCASCAYQLSLLIALPLISPVGSFVIWNFIIQCVNYTARIELLLASYEAKLLCVAMQVLAQSKKMIS